MVWDKCKGVNGCTGFSARKPSRSRNRSRSSSSLKIGRRSIPLAMTCCSVPSASRRAFRGIGVCFLFSRIAPRTYSVKLVNYVPYASRTIKYDRTALETYLKENTVSRVKGLPMSAFQKEFRSHKKMLVVGSE